MRPSDLLVRQKARTENPRRLVVGGIFVDLLVEQLNDARKNSIRQGFAEPVQRCDLHGSRCFGLVIEVTRDDALEVR